VSEGCAMSRGDVVIVAAPAIMESRVRQ